MSPFLTERDLRRPFLRETSARRVHFGPGSVDHVADEVAALDCDRVLVVSGGSALSGGRYVAGLLGDRYAGELTEIRQHVPEELAAAAVDNAQEIGADGLCSVGGGSATGLAKAVAVELAIPIVAVPTTYAGSEMTPVWGITGPHKRTGRASRAAPRVVVYDSELTVGLSQPVTAASGLNAVAHAVSVELSGADPVASLQSAEALRILARSLPKAVARPDDLGVRTEVLLGAYLAAGSLESGRVEGVHHRLCHILGGTHRLVHADVHAVLLPHTVAYEQWRHPPRVDSLKTILQTDDPGRWIHDFARRIGAPTGLAGIGMPPDGLEEAAKRAAGAFEADMRAFRRLLDDAYEGRSPAAVPAG